MRVATEVLSSPKPPHPSGLRPATFPLCGEGFKVLQIRRNLPHCGTFGYIYWELGRSAPVGGGASRVGGPSSASHSLGTFPPVGRLPGVPVCRPYGTRGTSMTGGSGTRPYGVFTNGSAYKKRDRFRTCPLKPRGEAKLRRKFLCLLSFSKKVRGSGGKPEPLTCVCCKGEGEMGDMYDYWVR